MMNYVLFIFSISESDTMKYVVLFILGIIQDAR